MIHKIIRSKRRTLALEICTDAKVIIRAPFGLPEHKILDFVNSKQNWIEKKKKLVIKKQERNPLKNLDQSLIRFHKEQAKKIIPERVKHFAEIMGVNYLSVSINNAKKRFGSCSSKNSLNFSWRIILMPLHILDYIVVHELAHIMVKNHSKNFWHKVAQFAPDYKQRNKWLRESWG